MKALLVSLLLCACHPVYADEVYFKLGAGYKLQELKIYLNQEQEYFDEPLTARFELGVQQGAWTYGIAHHSQWLTGWPVNNKTEYYKTEVFIDYRFNWSL